MKNKKILCLVFFLSSCFLFKTEVSNNEYRVYLSSSKDVKKAWEEVKKQGSLDEAISYLKKKNKVNKKDKQSMIKLARLYLIRADKKDIRKAQKLAEKIKEIDYKNSSALLILANISFLKGFLERSRLILEQIGGGKSKNTEVLNLLAGIHFREKNDQKCIYYLKLAKSINKNDFASNMNLGLIYLKHQEFKLAKKYLLIITKKYPKYLDAKLSLGVAYAGLNELQKAENLYEQVISGGSSNYKVYYNMAVIKFNQKKFNESMSYLEDYLEKVPRSSRHLAIKKTKELIHEIQVVNIKSRKISSDDIEDLKSKIKSSKYDKKISFEDYDLEAVSEDFVFGNASFN